MSARSAWALVYLVLVGAIVGYSAYVWLLKVSTPAKASTYAFVNPVVAVVLGWALAGEPIGPRVVGAGALVIAAVVLITLAGRTRWAAQRFTVFWRDAPWRGRGGRGRFGPFAAALARVTLPV